MLLKVRLYVTCGHGGLPAAKGLGQDVFVYCSSAPGVAGLQIGCVPDVCACLGCTLDSGFCPVAGASSQPHMLQRHAHRIELRACVFCVGRIAAVFCAVHAFATHAQNRSFRKQHCVPGDGLALILFLPCALPCVQTPALISATEEAWFRSKTGSY